MSLNNSKKMKRNKIIIILLLPFLIEIVAACCDCVGTANFNYSNCSLSIENIDNSGPEPVITQDINIAKDIYGIQIIINRNENICKVNRYQPIFFQSAYAYSGCQCPPEEEYVALDSIVSIAIKTANDFDAEHLENTDISEYFYVYQGFEFSTIEEFITNSRTTLYNFENPDNTFNLLMITPPSIGAEHQFMVTVELSDGRTFEAQTEILNLF